MVHGPKEDGRAKLHTPCLLMLGSWACGSDHLFALHLYDATLSEGT